MIPKLELQATLIGFTDSRSDSGTCTKLVERALVSLFADGGEFREASARQLARAPFDRYAGDHCIVCADPVPADNPTTARRDAGEGHRPARGGGQNKT